SRAVGLALADGCGLGRRAHRTRPIEAGRGGSRMPPARLVAVLVLGAALLAIRPVTAAAQSELQAWLNPEMGKQIPRADYRYTFYPERKVQDQETHFTMTEQRVTLFAPLYQDSTDEFAFAAKTLYQDIDTRARFPEAGGRFPSELWDASASVSYRHKFDNGWTGGSVARDVGDLPAVTGLRRIPVGQRPFIARIGKTRTTRSSTVRCASTRASASICGTSASR